MKKLILTICLILSSLSAVTYAEETALSEMQQMLQEQPENKEAIIKWKANLFVDAQKKLKQNSKQQKEVKLALEIDPFNKRLLAKKSHLNSEWFVLLEERTKHFNDLKEIAPFHKLVSPRVKSPEEIALEREIDQEIDKELGITSKAQSNDQRQEQEPTSEFQRNHGGPMWGGPDTARRY